MLFHSWHLKAAQVKKDTDFLRVHTHVHVHVPMLSNGMTRMGPQRKEQGSEKQFWGASTTWRTHHFVVWRLSDRDARPGAKTRNTLLPSHNRNHTHNNNNNTWSQRDTISPSQTHNTDQTDKFNASRKNRNNENEIQPKKETSFPSRPTCVLLSLSLSLSLSEFDYQCGSSRNNTSTTNPGSTTMTKTGSKKRSLHCPSIASSITKINTLNQA